MPEGSAKIAPHPTYKKQVIEVLDALDGLSREDIEVALVFLRLWAAMESSRTRRWKTEIEEYPARVLGGSG